MPPRGERAPCPVCGEMMGRSSIGGHRGKNPCMHAKTCNDLRARGLVPLTIVSDVFSQCCIPIESGPSGRTPWGEWSDGSWAPAWAVSTARYILDLLNDDWEIIPLLLEEGGGADSIPKHLRNHLIISVKKAVIRTFLLNILNRPVEEQEAVIAEIEMLKSSYFSEKVSLVTLKVISEEVARMKRPATTPGFTFV